jgi:SM-20-related protein
MYNHQYEYIANALVNDGYVIIENALDFSLPLKLKNFAKAQNNFHQAGISGASELHFDASKRRDTTLWLDEDSAVQSEYLDFAKGLQTYLNKELYLGLSYYESHFAIYREGDFYEKHLDAFKNFKNRIVTTVYYLNEGWTESDAGVLVIYDKEEKIISSVLPKANTLVVFLSDKFPHEVLPAKRMRYSIAGWFRVDK